MQVAVAQHENHGTVEVTGTTGSRRRPLQQRRHVEIRAEVGVSAPRRAEDADAVVGALLRDFASASLQFDDRFVEGRKRGVGEVLASLDLTKERTDDHLDVVTYLVCSRPCRECRCEIDPLVS
ncbi:hypothetical protein [Mycobacterium sp. IDR2000157661]|uniref:hypothetical protein n=1 Tax=Mycobacterium sp. IDR2000157661 TaxID=2867005 RepID=UPI001EED77A1|nr:hypothetical protein [Mycobacterium sp. IDR2000157661]